MDSQQDQNAPPAAAAADEKTFKLTAFSDEAHDSTFHFQILHLTDQLYIWVGCNTVRMGHMYAALATPWVRSAMAFLCASFRVSMGLVEHDRVTVL
jgi:hypothetical protein